MLLNTKCYITINLTKYIPQYNVLRVCILLCLLYYWLSMMWYDSVQWWGDPGACQDNVQCMHNSLIICRPVVDTGCSVVCTAIALVGGTGGYMQQIAVCPGLTFPGGFGGHLSECGMHWIILPWDSVRYDICFKLIKTFPILLYYNTTLICIKKMFWL